MRSVNIQVVVAWLFLSLSLGASESLLFSAAEEGIVKYIQQFKPKEIYFQHVGTTLGNKNARYAQFRNAIRLNDYEKALVSINLKKIKFANRSGMPAADATYLLFFFDDTKTGFALFYDVANGVDKFKIFSAVKEDRSMRIEGELSMYHYNFEKFDQDKENLAEMSRPIVIRMLQIDGWASSEIQGVLAKKCIAPPDK